MKYIEKVSEEQKELGEKISKLALFIFTDDDFKKLSEEKQDLLKDQFEIMKEYYEILHKRLKLEGI